LTGTDKQNTKQYSKIHKLNTTQKSKRHKIQQNKTTLVQSPLTTLGQKMKNGLIPQHFEARTQGANGNMN